MAKALVPVAVLDFIVHTLQQRLKFLVSMAHIVQVHQVHVQLAQQVMPAHQRRRRLEQNAQVERLV
jgi:uncharacterized membrane protein